MKTLSIVVTLCMVTGSAPSQPTDSLHSVLSVFTEPDGAEVYVDSILVGRSPVENLRVTAGRHTVRAVYPSAAEWSALSIGDTIVLAPGDATVKRYGLGTSVRINTVPPGAVVGAGDSALGMTPYIFRSPLSQPAVLSLRKEGYADSTIRLHPTDGSVRITLSPEGQSGERSRRQETLQGPEVGSDGAWATYAASASVIGFGIATAYFKHEADRNFDLYLSTNDPKYLDSTKKLDRAALWTLLITELSFGLLAYLLLSE